MLLIKGKELSRFSLDKVRALPHALRVYRILGLPTRQRKKDGGEAPYQAGIAASAFKWLSIVVLSSAQTHT